MKLVIDVEEDRIKQIIKDAVHNEMSERGLLRHIRNEVNSVFHSWQKGHKTYLERLDNLHGRVCALEKYKKGEEE